MPEANPTVRAAARIAPATPRSICGALPISALLLGAVNSPAPTPTKAKHAARYAGATFNRIPLSSAMPTPIADIPAVAGKRTPMRSESQPLGPVSAIIPTGTAVMNAPVRIAVNPPPIIRKNGMRNVSAPVAR